MNSKFIILCCFFTAVFGLQADHKIPVKEIVYQINITESGFLTSPNYPSNYLDAQRVVYNLNSWKYPEIRLEIDDFNLEDGYDYLRIYNGPSESYPLIGTYTATCIDKNIYGDHYDLTLVFTSDESVTYRGFRIFYWTYDDESKNMRRIKT